MKPRFVFNIFAAAIVMMLPTFAVAQKAPAITGISHLTLLADDIPKSKQFYVNLLGWDAVPGRDASPGIRFYANHAQYVELIAPPKTGLANRLDSVGFSTADAEALRKFLAAKGLAVPKSITVGRDGSKSFRVLDPEGNKVAFVQEGKRSLTPPKDAAESVSSHIMHAGYQVHNREALDHFYKDLLGFHLYWQGGNPDTRIDWVMMQVPNGTDWIEYMLNLPDTPSREQLGSANHLAPGVVSVAELQKHLERRGWKAPDQSNPQILGVDGKMQLDLHDPDGTRVEFMEFKPVKEPCCSPYTGTQPSASAAW